jgi:putative glycosyltransferase (TIGR04372 family)
MQDSGFYRALQSIFTQFRKTIDRPSRLITGPLIRCVRVLVRRPSLVWVLIRTLPEGLIKILGLSSLYLAAGQELFQRDRPEEAWLFMERYLRIARPSIDQYLLSANCLYQGLGRLHDALALLTRANLQSVDEVTALGLAKVPYRVLDSVWARHIGHLGIVDYVIKLAIMDGRGPDDTILYLPPGSPVANRFLLDQVAAYFRLVERAGDLPFPASAVHAMHYDLFAPRLPDKSTVFYWDLAASTYQRWEQEGRGPLLKLPPDIVARGWDALKKSGVPQDAWFVTLHVREREPDGRKSGLNAIRNAEVSTYFPAIAEITRRGGWVVRLGDPGMARLPALPNVIDYCHSAIHADWMDIFLLARCRFLVGTNSGPAFVLALYGTPAVLTNWWPAAERPWHASDIFVPKLLRRLSNGQYVTLSETLCEPLGWSYSLRYLAKRCGVGIEDNHPEMIRAAVAEMLTRLDGPSQPAPGGAALRARADEIYQKYGVAGRAQLASDFLRRHSDLIA